MSERNMHDALSGGKHDNNNVYNTRYMVVAASATAWRGRGRAHVCVVCLAHLAIDHACIPCLWRGGGDMYLMSELLYYCY